MKVKKHTWLDKSEYNLIKAMIDRGYKTSKIKADTGRSDATISRIRRSEDFTNYCGVDDEMFTDFEFKNQNEEHKPEQLALPQKNDLDKLIRLLKGFRYSINSFLGDSQ